MSTRAPGPDGPDEVHREQIGKLELARQRLASADAAVIAAIHAAGILAGPRNWLIVAPT